MENNYLRKNDIYNITIIVLLFFILMMQIIPLFINKENVYKYIEQSAIIEVVNIDNTKSQGTAILISNKEVLTVAHLFNKEYNKINIYIYGDETPIIAEIIKKDEKLDLALLEIPQISKQIKKIKFAKKEDISFGTEIMKIGNALGYGLSVNKGVVSSPYLKLNINSCEREVIGVSIPIMKGDSGGTVFSFENKFIGLISFKTSPTTNNETLSYIVPSYIIKNFINN